MVRSVELESLIEPVTAGLGYELVGVEYIPQGRHSLVRVYIDRPDGISVDDCEKISRQVSALLDVEDPIRGQYVLEVSSPGLDRPLFSAQHFVRFAGHKSKIRLRSPLEGRRNFVGVLRGVDEGMVVMEMEEREYRLPLDMIEKANLVPEI